MSKASNTPTPGHKVFLISVGVEVRINDGNHTGWTGKVTHLETSPEVGDLPEVTYAEVMFPDGSVVVAPASALGPTED